MHLMALGPYGLPNEVWLPENSISGQRKEQTNITGKSFFQLTEQLSGQKQGKSAIALYEGHPVTKTLRRVTMIVMKR
jgi:hypothetical protein